MARARFLAQLNNLTLWSIRPDQLGLWCLSMLERLTPTPTANDRELEPDPSGTLGRPQLLWPSITFQGMKSQDAQHFPCLPYVHARRKACCNGAAMKLVAFEAAVSDAKERLLVLDPHFDKVGVDALQDAFIRSQVRTVQFLTGGGKDNRESWRKNLEQCINDNRKDDNEVVVEWRSTPPILHDRFAIVDTALWHFGATVGGGHNSVNAASGPWPADEMRAPAFFDECWRMYDA